MPVTTQRASQIFHDITSQIVCLQPPKLLMPPNLDNVNAPRGSAAGADAHNIYLPQTTLELDCVDDYVISTILLHELAHVLLWRHDSAHEHGAQFQTLVSCLSARAGLPAFCADDFNYTQEHFSYVSMSGVKRLQSHVHVEALKVIDRDKFFGRNESAEDLAYHIFRTVKDRFSDKLLQPKKLSDMLHDAALTTLLFAVAMALLSNDCPALLDVSVCLIIAVAAFGLTHREANACWCLRV